MQQLARLLELPRTGDASPAQGRTASRLVYVAASARVANGVPFIELHACAASRFTSGVKGAVGEVASEWAPQHRAKMPRAGENINYCHTPNAMLLAWVEARSLAAGPAGSFERAQVDRSGSNRKPMPRAFDATAVGVNVRFSMRCARVAVRAGGGPTAGFPSILLRAPPAMCFWAEQRLA